MQHANAWPGWEIASEERGAPAGRTDDMMHGFGKKLKPRAVARGGDSHWRAGRYQPPGSMRCRTRSRRNK